MKISLWQQFSSNHSANFTVVGTFESAEKANAAAAELRRILARIRTWWSELPSDTPNDRKEGLEWHDKTETSELTPPEIELSREYQVNWPFTINWYNWTSWDHKDDPVSVFEQFVVIGNPHPYIYCGPQPFDELMSRLGGQAAINVDESHTHPDEALLLDVRCKLPLDTDTAKLLYESFSEDFTVYRDIDNYLYYGYKPHIKFIFSIDIVFWLLPPGVRVYEIERESDYLCLYGINITEIDALSEALPNFRNYLTQEGCTDIQFSFHSSPILGSKDEPDEP